MATRVLMQPPSDFTGKYCAPASPVPPAQPGGGQASSTHVPQFPYQRSEVRELAS